jgi:hypothetical protein
MNWIIRKTNKLSGHTYLNEVLIPILDDLEGFNWLLCDLEFGYTGMTELPINMDEDYFLLSENEFNKLLNADVQIYWGVILGIPPSINIEIDKDNLPYAEGNGVVVKNGNIQHKDAQIEVICYDSGYTIVKFRDPYLSDKFKNYFTEAVELEKFRNKSFPYY